MRKILLSLAAWFAERERMILIERTKQGMQRARKEGKRIGRPPKMEQVVSEVVSTLMRGRANKSTLTKISKKYSRIMSSTTGQESKQCMLRCELVVHSLPFSPPLSPPLFSPI